jgi:hypothetical protein
MGFQPIAFQNIPYLHQQSPESNLGAFSLRHLAFGGSEPHLNAAEG